MKNKILLIYSALAFNITFSHADVNINALSQRLGMCDKKGNMLNYNAMNVIDKFQGVFYETEAHDLNQVAQLYTHYVCTGKMRINDDKPLNVPTKFFPPVNGTLISQNKATDPQKQIIKSVFKTMFEQLRLYQAEFNYKDYIKNLLSEFPAATGHINGVYLLADTAKKEDDKWVKKALAVLTDTDIHSVETPSATHRSLTPIISDTLNEQNKTTKLFEDNNRRSH